MNTTGQYRFFPKLFSKLTALLAVMALLGIPTAQALIWDPSEDLSGMGGSGTWNATNANWSNGISDGIWDGTLASVAGPVGTITVDTDTVFFENLSLALGGYTIASANGGTLRTETYSSGDANILVSAGTGNTTISSDIDLNGAQAIGPNSYSAFRNASSGTVTLSGNLNSVTANRGVLFRQGSWALSGSNTITGEARIQATAGSPVNVSFASPDALSGITSLAVIGNSGTHRGLAAFNGGSAYNIGVTTVLDNHSQIASSANVTFSGTVFSPSDSTAVSFSSTATTTVDGDVWVFGGSGNGAYGLSIETFFGTHLVNNADLQGRGPGTAGSLDVTINGPGTVDMLGASTYDNDVQSSTTINRATVNANDLDSRDGASSFGTNTSSLIMQNGAVLNYVGTTGVMNRGLFLGTAGPAVSSFNVVNAGTTLTVKEAVTAVPMTELNLGGAGNLIFEDNLGSGGPLPAFVKNGTGTVTLAASATAYSAYTEVTTGRLDVNGSLFMDINAYVWVKAAGILGGDGGSIFTIGTGTILLEGTLSPNASGSGSLYAATLDWANGADFEFHLGGSLNSDTLILAGALNKSGSGSYVFNFLNAGVDTLGTYDLVTFSSTDFVAGDFSFTGWAGLDGDFQIDSGNTLQFVVSTVPEPSTGLYLLTGAATLALIRRWRLRQGRV